MSWLLTRGRLPYLLCLAAITVWLGAAASQVGVERSNESLKTRDETQAAIYERFKQRFGSDEDMLLVVDHPRLLAPEGLAFIAKLTERVAGIEGVGHVYSLTNAKYVVAGAEGVELAAVIGPDALDARESERQLHAAIDANPALTGLFIAADRKTAGLLVEIEDRQGAPGYPASVIDALRSLVAEQSAPGIGLHLTGVAVQKHDVSRYIARDQRVLMPIALVVLGGLLASFFRRGLGVILPLAVTGVTVIWTLGLYALAGLQLNAITSLLPPILMVLSMAVSIHLVQGWLDVAPGRGSRLERVRCVVRTLRFPCFFCALTTAFGFSSLATNEMPAVQQFGIFAGIGTMISFVVGMTLVPVGLTFMPTPSSRPTAAQRRLTRRVLEWCADLSTRHPWRVLGVTVALTAISLAGLPSIRNNTDLVRFLKADAPLLRDTLFIDQHLTGANTLEYVVSRRDGKPLTGVDDVRRMAAFERAILAQPHVTDTASVLVVLRQLHRAVAPPNSPELPENERDTAYVFDLLDAAPEQDLLRKLVADDFTAMRFSVRMRAVGTAESAPVADTIEAEGARIFGPGYRLDSTGAFYHIVRDSDRLVRAQVTGVASALLFVFVTTGLVFRSLPLIGIALIAYVVPLLWTAGLMGATGIDLSTGTVMIASAVLGMVVDDTIHYLAHFVRTPHDDVGAAVRKTTVEVGTALVTNNVVQVLGFWVGCFGSFKPTIYFSLMSGITMISALLCDLLVTPAFLTVSYRHRKVRKPPLALTALILFALVLCARPASAGDEPRQAGDSPGAPRDLEWQDGVPPALSGLFDAKDDSIFARAYVPSAASPVGEVRLIRRSQVDVVQTLLYSKVLLQVVAEIRKKESVNWPVTSAAYADAVRYMTALDQTRRRLWDEIPLNDRRADRRQKMIIEFVLDASRAAVMVGGFELEDRGELRVTERRPFLVWEPSRAYVERNMGLIVADAFKLDGAALAGRMQTFAHAHPPAGMPTPAAPAGNETRR